MKLKDKIQIPVYSLSEELISSISHGIGVCLGILALVLCVIKSSKTSVISVVSSSLYGSSMIILYATSTIYHALGINNGKRVFRVLDHCMIYLLIFGTYIPYTLVGIGGCVGWVVFGIVLFLAVIGIILNAIDLKKFKVISMVLYILMGWSIMFVFKKIYNSIDFYGLVLLVLGGVLYTIGAIIYGIGKKHKYFHCIFHIFILLGTILQFFSIYFYVI